VGHLYLTEKEDGGEFTEEDEEAAVVLAQWAGTAIDNAMLYESSERRREELERAVRSLEAARDITEAIGSADQLDRVLELIVKRGRALVDARSVLIMLREGDELVVAASAGHASGARGSRVPICGSTSGQVLERSRAQRITDVSSHLSIAPETLGVPDAHTALLVPMIHGGMGVGVLAAFDRSEDSEAFSADDELLLRSFAQSAANAVAGLEITSELALPHSGPRDAGLTPELETTIYRLVQEALSNVAKHARASCVRVFAGVVDGEEVIVEVQDDGVGFDSGTRTTGFGLPGMRERVYLAGGTLHVESKQSGTLVRARLPARGAPTGRL
jgi:GAF domain-containing protein